MKAFWAFTKKELLEGVRTWRFLILLVVFVALGVMSPLTAKLIPFLLETMVPEGMSIAMSDPTAWDSWTQFFKNVGQMGLVVLVIVYCGTMANEFGRSTLINILTKGMLRPLVILAKFATSAVVWTVCYLVSLGITAAYTLYYWEPVGMNHVGLAFAGLWLFGLLLLALLHMGGVLFKGLTGGLLLTGGVVVALMLVSIAPAARPYDPMTLATDNLALLTGQSAVGDFIPALIICALLAVAFLTLAILAFNRKQL